MHLSKLTLLTLRKLETELIDETTKGVREIVEEMNSRGLLRSSMTISSITEMWISAAAKYISQFMLLLKEDIIQTNYNVIDNKPLLTEEVLNRYDDFLIIGEKQIDDWSEY
jgi:hypothetical protein